MQLSFPHFLTVIFLKKTVIEMIHFLERNKTIQLKRKYLTKFINTSWSESDGSFGKTI